MRVRGARGFTLIEVLIALAFLAIGMSAIITTVGASIRNAGELQSDTYAHWVAMNQLSLFRLASSWPETGSQQGSAELAGQKWNWDAKISTTPDPDLRRVDIDVSPALAPHSVAASITGFIGRPFATAPLPAASTTTPPAQNPP
ncbi:MAG: type II secretion system minor pseudopilin GspI [Gammaproteobacteria bacterium]